MIRRLRAFAHRESMDERPGEPALGTLDRSREAFSEGESRRDSRRERAARSMKTSRNDGGGLKHLDLPTV